MKRRYVLAPEAALDLVQIWRFIQKESSAKIADRVEAAIRDQIVSLAERSGIGHWQKDLTSEAVKFPSLFLSHCLSARHETFARGRRPPRPPECGASPESSPVIVPTTTMTPPCQIQ
jgi:plasmid stabilization system protein ParE